MILPNIKNRFLDPCKYIDELFRKRICVQILNMKVEYLSGVETLVFFFLFSMYKKWNASKMFDAIYTNIDVQMLKLVTKAVPIYQLKREKCTNHLSCIASANLKQIYLLVTLGFLFFTCLNWDTITYFVARPLPPVTWGPMVSFGLERVASINDLWWCNA